MSHTNRILVTGATGTVGQLVVSSLLERGATVRVLTRNAEKAATTFGSKVEFSRGDVSDREWLKGSEAFAGVQRLFLLTVSSADQPALERDIVRAAKSAGVGHVVKLSVQGATQADPSSSLMRWHAFAEDEIIASGVPYTVLRPNLFLQNFLRDDAKTIKATNKFYRPAANCRISHVDCRDIADVAATVLTEPIDKHNGFTYYVSGPESLTYTELAAHLSQALGKPIEYVPVDDYAAYTTFKGQGFPEAVCQMIIKLFQFYRTNAASEVFLDSKIVTGKDPRTALQFFTDYKHQFL
jgi:uncharacterized protein YbjT (DUF2867 family)